MWAITLFVTMGIMAGCSDPGVAGGADSNEPVPEIAQIAKAEDIELTEGVVARGRDSYTMTGTITNTGTHVAPRVKVWGVIKNFGVKDVMTGLGRYAGNHRGQLGEFKNLRPGESREFTFFSPTRVYISKIQTLDKSQMSDYDASQLSIFADAPKLEFEVLPE